MQQQAAPLASSTNTSAANRTTLFEPSFRFIAVLVGGLLLACALIEDFRTPMWIDELYTLHVAQQANVTEIAKAALEGCDAAPPLYAMIVHAILPLVRNDAVAVRLPSTIGFCLMFLLLLVFCRQRLPAVYALIGALMAAYACREYATEGRAYGIVLGCAAGALLSWQSVRGRRRIFSLALLAFCLALMTALHYYALFFLAPLGIAELVRWRITGKLDVPVFAAMVPAVAVLSAHYPFLAADKRFEVHYWSPASWSMLPDMYRHYYIRLGLVVTALLALFAFQPIARKMPTTFEVPEWTALAVFPVMPLAVFTVSRYTTHAFVDRYALWALVGMAVLVSGLVCAAARGRQLMGIALLGVLLTAIIVREATALRSPPVLREGESVAEALQSLTDGAVPIVIADHHVFMELSYYAPAAIRARIVYPLSRDLDLRYSKQDTSALLMAALRSRDHLPIVDYDEMVAQHPRFVLAALPIDYLPAHLARTGFRVTPLDSSVSPVLYRVERE